MKKINKRRLNNKGFTLIELLAVIVILAIVMGIAATNVIQSINNSRVSSLYSAAQNAANTLNTWASEDMLITNDDQKKLGDGFVSDTQTGAWICLGDPKLKIKNKTANRNVLLTDALSLGKNQVDLYYGKATNNVWGTLPSLSNGAYSITLGTTCSALRYNKSTGGYEFLFVAYNGGKYYVSSLGNSNYAFSRATKSGESISD